jgi:predicted ArsR family transcriptional regulator
MEAMTIQQRNIYLFINQYRGEHGYSPNRNEIAANVNIHPSTVREHLVSMKNKGYQLIRINTLKGFKTYPPDEETRIDKFNHPYMGRDYGGYGYELLSTGIEKLFYGEYTNKLDRDFDSFIIGLLSGVGYVHYNRKNRK